MPKPPSMRRGKGIGAILIAALLAPSPLPAADAVPVDPAAVFPAGSAIARPAEPGLVRFAVENRGTLEEEGRIYAAFLRYLEGRTGRRFALRFVRRNEAVGEVLGSGAVDFSIIGAFNYVRSRRDHDLVPLAKELDAEGRGESRSAIVTRPTGGPRRVADLKGGTFVFVREGSTRGHLIPRILLNQAGVRLTDLRNYAYADSNDRAVAMVLSGGYDAAGMQAPFAVEMERKGLVRVVARSEGYPSSIIAANGRTDPALAARVREALLAMRPTGADREALPEWEKTDAPGGYTAVDRSEYDGYERELERLGLLPPPGVRP